MHGVAANSSSEETLKAAMNHKFTHTSFGIKPEPKFNNDEEAIVIENCDIAKQYGGSTCIVTRNSKINWYRGEYMEINQSFLK